MKRRLAILWLENAAALIHVIAMNLHETAQEIKREERARRRPATTHRVKYEDWMEGLGVKR